MASAEHCRDQIAFFSKPYFLGELFPFPFNDNKKSWSGIYPHKIRPGYMATFYTRLVIKMKWLFSEQTIAREAVC